jgi:hypothetical protein
VPHRSTPRQVLFMAAVPLVRRRNPQPHHSSALRLTLLKHTLAIHLQQQQDAHPHHSSAPHPHLMPKPSKITNPV